MEVVQKSMIVVGKMTEAFANDQQGVYRNNRQRDLIIFNLEQVITSGPIGILFRWHKYRNTIRFAAIFFRDGSVVKWTSKMEVLHKPNNLVLLIFIRDCLLSSS